MVDPRLKTLAKNLINYSIRLKKGEKVLIEDKGLEVPFVEELVREAYNAGAMPFVTIKSHNINRALFKDISMEHIKLMAKFEADRMKEMDAYINLVSDANSSESSDISADKGKLIRKYFWNEVHGKISIPKTKWVVLRYPNPGMAQAANMSTEAFEDFYFNVCNLDYSKMDKAMEPLKKLMEKTNRVKIIGPETNLEFSIKGLPVIKCSGQSNIPDGEIYTAPVKNSVNGYIKYNTPSCEYGYNYENIRLEFKDGKIIKATANNTEKINKVFDTDEGAKYIGEFSFGVNPYITKAMKDTLFDEKIAGSIHFTPGASYDDCYNGNKSAIHWDLVYIQTPEYGGGEIYFDDVLVRKDGRFVLSELVGLNPENLK